MEELGLDFNNILDDDEISSLLFNDDVKKDEEPSDDDGEEKEGKKDTAEVDPDNLFEEEPESVGSGKNKQGEEEDTTGQKSGASPNFFSSIATAFAEEGIFPDLDEDTINKINDAQSFRDAIDMQIKAGLTEQQRKIAEALDNGVEPDKIRQYQYTIGWLEGQEKNIDVEGDAGDDLRRRIIMQDYINKGFGEKRAEAKVNKIFEDGLDVEEAKESLQSLKDTYKSEYEKLCDDAREEAKKEEKKMKEKAERIKKSILDEKGLFGNIEISDSVRKSAYEAVSKPVYKDPDTGEVYTAVQKYEHDNSEEFIAKLGLLYTLTDGFKSIDKLVDKKVKKEMKKGFSELERRINNTSRNSDGSLNFASGVSDDDSFIGKGVRLDL